jgi:hypothetical protein
MRRWILIALVVFLLAFGGCSQAEKADSLANLKEKPAAAVSEDGFAAKLAELQACCDDNSRAMGAQCCFDLDNLLAAHSGKGSGAMGGGAMGDMPQFKSGRPVEVDPAVAARWPQVKILFGKKDEPPQALVVDVGKTAPLPGTPLTIEVEAFVPAFKMGGGKIGSAGMDPTNPAAKVAIREAGKDDWAGWLFAKMPTVHAFEHEVYAVVLAEGVPKP